MENFLTLPRIEFRPFGRPARSQSLYRLRYRGSFIFFVDYTNSEGIYEAQDDRNYR
jgi:hypothetical protein